MASEPNTTTWKLDGSTLVVRVRMTLQPIGGRKTIVAPEQAKDEMLPRPAGAPNALKKALIRGFRWQKLLEDGTYSTIDEIAAAEKINNSYVCRVMRLTTLAPDIIRNILDNRRHDLRNFLKPFSSEWPQQRTAIR